MITHFKDYRPDELYEFMGPTMPCQWCGAHMADGDGEGLCDDCQEDCAYIYSPASAEPDGPVFVFDNGDNNPDPYFTCRIHGEGVNE